MRNPNCKRCSLHTSCTHVCLWGDGNLKSPLMIVGEAPGRDEDAEGLPFIGKAGSLLNHCLSYLSIPRESVYVTNAVKCRPPDNKLPTRKGDRADILAACAVHLEAEFKALNPKVVLVLGSTALQALSGGASISMWQGRELPRYKTARLFAGYHPAYVMRSPSVERCLTAAIQIAANAAGIETKWNEQSLFNYEEY